MRVRLDYSLITPSRGDRPNALRNAIQSVAAALALAAEQGLGLAVEMLVGFDGVKGERITGFEFVRSFDFPEDRDHGNAIRHGLLKASRGRRLIFLDDDNALAPNAFVSFSGHPEADMLVGRIRRACAPLALSDDSLPRVQPGRSLVRQGNIDPLCCRLDRALVVDRCGGWSSQGGYEADYLNLLRYSRRAKTLELIDDVVGIYDAGLGLDKNGLSPVQRMRLAQRDQG